MTHLKGEPVGIRKVVTVNCEFPGCTNGPGGKPSSLTWCETDVLAGRISAPPESGFLVILTINGGATQTFCCQLCASRFFLPPGYDIIRRKVETISGAVSQPDGVGEDSPENGQCTCSHPPEVHSRWGCTEVLSDKIGDFCKCKFGELCP